MKLETQLRLRIVDLEEEVQQKSDLLRQTQAREVEYWERTKALEEQLGDLQKLRQAQKFTDLAHRELDRAGVPRYDEKGEVNAYLHLIARMKLVASSLNVFRSRIPDIEKLLDQMTSDLQFEWIKAAGQKLIEETSNT